MLALAPIEQPGGKAKHRRARGHGATGGGDQPTTIPPRAHRILQGHSRRMITRQRHSDRRDSHTARIERWIGAGQRQGEWSAPPAISG
jgi:hypothetical protein